MKQIIEQFQDMRPDPEEIARRVKEQRAATARMLAWPDLCPPADPRRG